MSDTTPSILERLVDSLGIISEALAETANTHAMLVGMAAAAAEDEEIELTLEDVEAMLTDIDAELGPVPEGDFDDDPVVLEDEDGPITVHLVGKSGHIYRALVHPGEIINTHDLAQALEVAA